MRKEKALTRQGFFTKLDTWGSGTYNKIADKLLEESRNTESDEFDLFHDCSHLARDALIFDRTPTEAIRMRLLEKHSALEKQLAEGKKITKHPHIYPPTEWMFKVIKSQLELKKIPVLSREI